MTIQVIDSKGNSMQNLVGVFRRVFPIVFGQVERTGETQFVGYYGERYRIERIA